MNKFSEYKIYYKITKLFLRKLFLGNAKRTENRVSKEYGELWGRQSGLKGVLGERVRLQKLGKQLIFCRAIDHRKFFMRYLSDTISSIQPQKLLELGSGNGFNILILAVLNPEIKILKGVELTESGVMAARNFLKNPPIEELVYVTGESKENVLGRLKNRDIEFVQGNMLDLPWKDNYFDFVFSCWVFEQIPKQYHRAFSEANRVVDGYAMFIEVFKEAQANIFQKLHLKNVDYFRSSFKEVEDAGFRILKFEPMMLTKIKFTSGALLCSSKK